MATPPWIWLYLIGYLAIGVPGSIRTWRWRIAEYGGHGDTAPAITARPAFTLLKVFAMVEVLPLLFLVAGVAAIALPAVRARRVERTFELHPDDRPVIAEMRRFVETYAPGVDLRVTLREDRLARIYPVGWRSARIAVFRPMATLWRKDRPAAQAVLLHEVAHLRNGDHLVVGLGSPFPWLVRVWAPLFLVAEFVPTVVFFASAPDLLSTAIGGQVVADLGTVPRQMILPVAALWLSELGADRFAAGVLGPPALRRSLERGRSPSAARLSVLSHPPRSLRQVLAGSPRVATLVLVTGWFAAMAGQLAVEIVVATPAFLLIGRSVPQTADALVHGVRAYLVDAAPVLLAALILLPVWPLVSRSWRRFWTGAPRRSPPAAHRQR